MDNYYTETVLYVMTKSSTKCKIPLIYKYEKKINSIGIYCDSCITYIATKCYGGFIGNCSTEYSTLFLCNICNNNIVKKPTSETITSMINEFTQKDYFMYIKTAGCIVHIISEYF